MNYPTDIKVWSRSGHTPLTKRGSAYCDLLLDTRIFCASPEAAREQTRDLIIATPHGHYGHFNMPAYPNQNTRSDFTRI